MHPTTIRMTSTEIFDISALSTLPNKAIRPQTIAIIPPIMEIRRGAKIESPHIMLLCNDKTDALVGGTGEFAKKPLLKYKKAPAQDKGLKAKIYSAKPESTRLATSSTISDSPHLIASIQTTPTQRRRKTSSMTQHQKQNGTTVLEIIAD